MRISGTHTMMIKSDDITIQRFEMKIDKIIQDILLDHDTKSESENRDENEDK